MSTRTDDHPPRVWLDMDQAALDAAYDQRNYAPTMAQIMGRYTTSSAAVRERLGPPRRLAYGETDIESLDVHVAPTPNAPVNVFIHGGAWRMGRASDYSFPAETFVRAGAHFVVPDFMAVQDADGSLLPLAGQVRSAVAWAYRNARSFGGDPERLYVSAHSSGAHLAAVLLTTDWAGEFELPADTVKGGVLCSGMYDLEPVRRSARGAYVRFNDDIVQALSPQRHIDRIVAPLVLAYGTLESPEFQRHSRDFAAALLAAGKSVELLVGEGYNHFEMCETLASPYGLLGGAVLAQMELR